MFQVVRARRFAYRLRLKELESAVRRWPDGEDAHTIAQARVLSARLRLPWWLRIDIDLTA
ncbi:hypothetical protein QTQ03_25195 [Micromonospora sp. WMMA1363]|uniref:hypothetical protein n=1 Tax=Micromonospora sp. WMMA1363 TaxID=3053985 RepID=UPI00259CB034|nr:hypothetical protein [Micromonospora sp. WMMA1363]MDM4722731.1 hypothetical protein [Micromonospora sp. WMMA1363]